MASFSEAKPATPQRRSPLVLRDTNALYDRTQYSPVYLLPSDDDTTSLKGSVRMQNAPSSPVRITAAPASVREPSSAEMGNFTPPPRLITPPRSSSIPMPQPAYSPELPRASSRQSLLSTSSSQPHLEDLPEPSASPLQYHHQPYMNTPARKMHSSSQLTLNSVGSSSSGESPNAQLRVPRKSLPRPHSAANSLGEARGRPQASNERLSPRASSRPLRAVSTGRFSPENRPKSYIDMLNEVPYHQQLPPAPILSNAQLQSSVGTNASLLDTKKTLEMYRQNIKKTTDPKLQYEFAMFLLNTAREMTASSTAPGENSAPELIKDAKEVLQKLADRPYPGAQYYLADGYASGFFNKGKPDHDKAFSLFQAASKHGHTESGYRTALCYEFGWGVTKSLPKAAGFLLTAASKGHVGAAVRLGLACLSGDLGLGIRYREGIKWLKRASEHADAQFNSGPYELGKLHVNGYGDDIFKDEAYAAQLFTQAAELGHPDANFRMGKAYELGTLGCPKDAALSVHFYNGAATAGNAEAMLALCAWYIVGAPPVLERDEDEAYEWAKKSAELGYDHAEYAVGCFTEMGVGCRSDPLEANVWYVRAADKGNEDARQRLAAIRAAASGETRAPQPMDKAAAKTKELAGKDKECIIM